MGGFETGTCNRTVVPSSANTVMSCRVQLTNAMVRTEEIVFKNGRAYPRRTTDADPTIRLSSDGPGSSASPKTVDAASSVDSKGYAQEKETAGICDSGSVTPFPGTCRCQVAPSVDVDPTRLGVEGVFAIVLEKLPRHHTGRYPCIARCTMEAAGDAVSRASRHVVDPER